MRNGDSKLIPPIKAKGPDDAHQGHNADRVLPIHLPKPLTLRLFKNNKKSTKAYPLTKLANFLSALDRKIESLATQITETQTFKRSLLQQMFV